MDEWSRRYNNNQQFTVPARPNIEIITLDSVFKLRSVLSKTQDLNLKTKPEAHFIMGFQDWQTPQTR